MTLLIASANPGKLKEMQRIIGHLGIDLITPAEVGVNPEVEETGATFADNAALKAWELFRKTGIPTVADDSGMCVDALGGRPSVLTARYGGEESNYPAKFQMLLSELDGVEKEDRGASFVSHICCVMDKDTVIDAEGICNGWIGFEPQGTDGFGFDPLFFVGETSFSQYTPEEKDKLSHRGKALALFAKQLQEHCESRGETL